MAVARDTTIAGNPFAFLNLKSDQRGGVVGVYLLDVDPNAVTCNEEGYPTKGVRLLSFGAADLRFHKGTMVGEDFPLDTPGHVRIDLFDLAATIPVGHKLTLVFAMGDPMGERDDLMSNGYFPDVSVVAEGTPYDSQLVLPIVSGTLGGDAPAIDYPPRPFVPWQ